MEKWITEFGEWLERQWINYTGTCLDENRGREWAFNCARVKFAEMYAAANIAPPAESLHEMAKRMCDTFECCDGCPLDGIHKDCLPGTISKLTDAQQQEQLDIMRKWNAENPPKHAKTYRQDFFEKFPGAQKRLDGYPIGWVCDFYKTRVKPQKFRAAYQYQKSWDAPLGYWEA